MNQLHFNFLKGSGMFYIERESALYLQGPRHGSNLNAHRKDEWINKKWYIYTIEHYSAIKKNGIMPFAIAWMNLEIIILSEVRQRQIYHLYVESLTNDTNEIIYKTEIDS